TRRRQGCWRPLAGRKACAPSGRVRFLKRSHQVLRKEELVRRFKTISGAGVALGLAALSALQLHSQGKTIDWRYFGGDKAFTRYSPADQITRDNVRNLRIVWRRPATNASFK